MPIKAVKQKPMANMDFMRTYIKNKPYILIECKKDIRFLFHYLLYYTYTIIL